ncbi:thiamine phosphate synthase, partial [Mycobacterium tuberculosis]|nr:thiamine phosphate synthase [Mycobacterium tuberculosis]
VKALIDESLWAGAAPSAKLSHKRPVSLDRVAREPFILPSAPQGLEQLARHIQRLADYPTVAIGGISLEKAPGVLATGVGSIAVVSAITQAADWRAATN